jgi:Zierdtviridae exonuclease
VRSTIVRPQDLDVPLLRTSERKDFRRCPWLWQQSWINGLRPAREPTWAIFGSAFHKAMEVRYPIGVRRGSLDDTIDAFLDFLDGEVRKVGVDLEELRDEDGEPLAGLGKKDVDLVLADELGEIMLRNYVRAYGRDRDWEVIHTEQPFQIDVPHPTIPGKVLVVYAGTWDALMRHRRTGKLWLWDHKTAKVFPDVNYLELDDQAGSYVWVAKEVLVHKGIITRKESIEGIIFNYAKKAKPDPRPTDAAGRSLNKDGSISARQPSARFLRHPAYRSPAASVQQARRVQAEAKAMAAMRDGTQPIYKNPTQDCPRCPLFDLCTLHEQQADGWEDYRDTFFVAKDVYADHRMAMADNGIELGGHK